MTSKKKTMLNVRMSHDDAHYLAEASQYLGISKSDVIRTLVRSFIREKVRHEYPRLVY